MTTGTKADHLERETVKQVPKRRALRDRLAPSQNAPSARGWTGLVLLACLGAQALQACGVLDQDCAQPDTRCAGLVTGFGSVDEPVGHEAWQALLEAKANGDLDRVDFIETIDTRDRAANIAAFADAGYDVIVTIGAGIAEETRSAAGMYPELHFIAVHQPQDAPQQPENLTAVVFREQDGGFLAGAAAALVSQTKRVAAVCESDYIDSVWRYCEGFADGVRKTEPDVQVDVAYRSGSPELLFRDLEWGRSTAIRQIEQGADVVFAVGEATAEAALVTAADRGALVIGADADLYADVPEIRPQLLTSAVLNVRLALLDLLRNEAQGQIRAGDYLGSVSLGPFHDLEHRISPETVTKLGEITVAVQSGSIDVQVPLEAP